MNGSCSCKGSILSQKGSLIKGDNIYSNNLVEIGRFTEYFVAPYSHTPPGTCFNSHSDRGGGGPHGTLAVSKKVPSIRLHVVTDSVIFAGLSSNSISVLTRVVRSRTMWWSILRNLNVTMNKGCQIVLCGWCFHEKSNP